MKKLVISAILKRVTGKILFLFVIYLISKFASVYLQKLSERFAVAAQLIKKTLQS